MTVPEATLEECALSGTCSLGNCSASYYYLIARQVNFKLRRMKANWLVKAKPKERSIVAVPIPN